MPRIRKRPTIFISAAEASADAHAAGLIRSLYDVFGDVRIVGLAGEKMAEAGCEVVADLTSKAGMLADPIWRINYYLRKVRLIRRDIRNIKPDIFIPVDSPALNWHFAAEAKRCGSAVNYFIAPQVWAWAPWRVRKLARLADHVSCILPFEEEYLRSRGVSADYVGHPLMDSLPARSGEVDLQEVSRTGKWRVALVPGSRAAEIRGHTPALVSAAEAIVEKYPHAECIFTARTEQCAAEIRRSAGRGNLKIAVGQINEVLASSHFAVAASGTVTLQIAHFGLPMVIFYHGNFWAYNLFAKHLIRTRYLSLVNILAGRQIVPELMPWFGDTQKLTAEVLDMMSDVSKLETSRRELLKVIASLEKPGGNSACDNAARFIHQAFS